MPALYEAVESCRDPQKRYLLPQRRTDKTVVRGRQQYPKPRSDLDKSTFGRITDKCERLLGTLCDVQAITGIAIIIAGWAQIDTLTYYHEELVMACWWLTLNSFWASRADFFDMNSKDDKIRLGVRRGTILCSCVLGLAFQGYIIHREYKTWDDEEGPCYRYQDGSSAIPWMVGVGLLCIALLASFSEWTKKLNKRYLDFIENVSSKLMEWQRDSRQNLDDSISHRASVPALQRIIKILTASFVLAIALTCRGFWSCLVVWLAVWSYGDCFWPVNWCFCVLFDVWITFQVISLWHLNQVLINDDAERQIKSFGQILPLVLIGSIVFSVIDVLRGK